MSYKRPQPLAHVRCPECGLPMLERTGKTGNFYGCSRFPVCVGTRPKGGDGVDSYTKLLQTTYLNAVRVLSSPKFSGFIRGPRCMFEQVVGKADFTEEEFQSFDLERTANELLERAIDWACAQTGVDFLVNAHEERFDHIKNKLKYLTSSKQMREMPKPEISRRYYVDSEIDALEAHLAVEEANNGQACPRCNGWSEELTELMTCFDGDEEIDARAFTGLKATPAVIIEQIIPGLEDKYALKLTRKWDCGRCGVYSCRIEYRPDGQREVSFSYENDKHTPGVSAGIVFLNRRPPTNKQR